MLWASTLQFQLNLVYGKYDVVFHDCSISALRASFTSSAECNSFFSINFCALLFSFFFMFLSSFDLGVFSLPLRLLWYVCVRVRGQMTAGRCHTLLSPVTEESGEEGTNSEVSSPPACRSPSPGANADAPLNQVLQRPPALAAPASFCSPNIHSAA